MSSLKIILTLVILGLVLGVLPVSATNSVAGFLRIIAVDYEVVNPQEDLEITIQTDKRIGYLEWYFDYYNSGSYHRIPFIPDSSGYFSFVIPSEFLQQHRGVHFLHVNKVVILTARSWASYSDSVPLQIGGTERMHVVGYQVVPPVYERGYAQQVEGNKIVVYEKADFGIPKGKILGEYSLSEWEFQRGWERLGNFYMPVLKGKAGNGWFWDEEWIPYGTGWTLHHNVKRIIEPAKVVVFGWTKSQSRRYDYFEYGHSYRIDVEVEISDQKFEIPGAEMGTVWQKQDLNVLKKVEEVKKNYREIYARDFKVEPEKIEVDVRFNWTTRGNWRILFSNNNLEWFKERGVLIETPLEPDTNGNFDYYKIQGLDEIPLPASWKWDPVNEFELSIIY